MKRRCEDELHAAAARPLTKAELDGIEERIGYHFRQAQAEAGANGWSREDAYREAATRAATEFKAEAAKKAQRLSLDIMARATKAERYAEMKAVYGGGAKGLGRLVEQSAIYLKGVKQQAFAKIVDTIDAAEPKFLKMLENRAAVSDFVREVYGHDTGNGVAKKGAKAWLDGIEEMRVRANRAGFNIGKLDYSYVPQPHDVVRMLKAGPDVWVGKIMPRLDRERYLNDAGGKMTDAELIPVLQRAFATITTNGTNKLDPTVFRGVGGRANRGSAHRELHFDGPDAYLAHMDEFGRGNVFDAMEAHVGALARDIGLVEEFGPNPQRHFENLEQQSIIDDHGQQKFTGWPLFVRPRDLWSSMSGSTAQSINPRWADFNQGLRNVVVGTKLTSTLLNSVNDIPTLLATAAFNRMPLFRTIGEVFKELGPQGKEYANRLGIVSESMISDMSQWSGNHFTSGGWTKKFADSTMKLSLLQGWTDALRRGFSISLMNTTAKMTRTDWGALNKGDRGRMEAAGVTEADWKIWQATPLQNWRGNQILHPDDIHAQRAGSTDDAQIRAVDRAKTMLLGFIAHESESAIVTQDLYTQAALTRGMQKGTIEGEFARNLMLFKGYPMALVSRHLRRIAELDMSKVGRVGLGMAFLSTMTLFGALATQLQSISAGKDPADMAGPHAGKFWGEAAARGGGLGIFGDLLYTGMGGNAKGGQANWLGLLGPVYGTGADAANISLGLAGKAIGGKKTHEGADVLRFARGNIPGMNVTNLWYTKAAMDHMLFHELQEEASPGYLARQQQRAMHDFGQSYWWKPGGNAFTASGRDQAQPERLPNLAAAIGGP